MDPKGFHPRPILPARALWPCHTRVWVDRCPGNNRILQRGERVREAQQQPAMRDIVNVKTSGSGQKRKFCEVRSRVANCSCCNAWTMMMSRAQ